MSDKNQTKFMLLLGLILVVIVGLIIFFAFGGDDDSEGSFAINPFAGGGGGGVIPVVGNNLIPNDDYTLEEFPLTQEEVARLVQLTKEPTIGVGISPDETKVRYFRRGVGHIYESEFHGQTGETRVSNTTIPKIIKASWTNSGEYAAITTLNNDVQRDFWLRLTGTSTLETAAFSATHYDRAFSPDGTELASFAKTGSTHSLTISDPDGDSGTTIFSTLIPDYEVGWVGDSTLFLKTKSSAFAPSLLQTISRSGRNLSVIESGKYGFDVVWSHNTDQYITSYTNDRGRNLETLLTDNDAGTITTLNHKTLAEKCVFSNRTPGVVYCAVPKTLPLEPLPDAWWKGQVEFDDELWKIDTTSNTAELLLENGGFDMTELLLSPDENYIFFINKDDTSLWSYRLFHNEEGEEDETTE